MKFLIILKKITIYLIFVVLIYTASSQKLFSYFPTGSALGFSLRFSFPLQTSLAVTGKFEGIPFMFGGILNIGISNKGASWFGFSAGADWWGYTARLGQLGNSDVMLYLGPGIEAIFNFGDKYINIEADFRIPVGVSFIVEKDWEIFLQLTPALSVISIGSRGFATFGWYPENSGWAFSDFFRFYGDFGFRYWF